MKLSIIIPNRNDVSLLGITLRSLLEDVSTLDFEPEIIVAENSDEDVYKLVSTGLVSQQFKNIKFMRQDFACLFTAFDSAAAAATGEYIIRLDSDMIVGKNMVADMLDFMERHRGEKIGFAHAPVCFFHQHITTAKHDVSLAPGKAMCRWQAVYDHERKITYKGMPWICRRDWYLKTLNGFGAFREHRLTPFGDPYLGIKPWLIGYENWAIPCRPGIHMGRMDFAKPFDTFKSKGAVGPPGFNSYTSAAVTAYIFAGEAGIEQWAPIFIRVGLATPAVEKSAVIHAQQNRDKILAIGRDDRRWIKENQVCTLDELIAAHPWAAADNLEQSPKPPKKKGAADMQIDQPQNLYQRTRPIWQSIAGKRAGSCIKEEDWCVIRSLIRSHKAKRVLEFGSGLSTILFDKLGLAVDSYETSEEFMQAVKNVCSERINFRLWDNNTRPPEITGKYDLALVDGIRPRLRQAEIAREHADVVIVHDIGVSSKGVPEKALPDWVMIENATRRTGVFCKPEATGRPRVSVIISHRNDFAMLGITVRAIIEDTIEIADQVEIVICDNSGAQEKQNLQYVIGPEYIKSEKVRIIDQKFPCLFTAREAAINAARGEYILCLDSHMLIGKNMIRDLLAYLDQAPDNIGFVHAPLVYVNQNESAMRHEFRTRTYYPAPHKTGIKGMPWICRKDFWAAMGGYGSLARHKMSWGGGDVYLALKPWFLGYENWAIPCRPGIHIGPFTKLDRKYYKYRMWGRSGTTPAWYGLLAAAYVLGADKPNNPVTQLRWYHCQTFDENPAHWEKIKELCEEERQWMQARQKMSLDEFFAALPWQK